MKRRHVLLFAAALLLPVLLIYLPAQSLAASTVVDLNASTPTATEQSRKVFKNPRGLTNYYVFYLDDTDTFVRYAYSADGSAWTAGNAASANALEMTTGDASSWATAIYDDGSQLHVYLAYEKDTNDRMAYRHGTISDTNTTITWATEQSFGGYSQQAYGVSLTLASNGRLFMAWSDERVPTSEAMRVFAFDTIPAGDLVSGAHAALAESDRLMVTANPTGTTNEINAVYQEGTGILNAVKVTSDGTAPTFGTKSEVTGMSLTRGKISAATDTQVSPKTHVALRNGTLVEHRTYDEASGLSAPTTVLAATPDSVSVAVDETSSPDKVFVFYVKNGVAGSIFFRTSPVDAVSFGSERTISDGSEGIDYLSAGVKDWGADSKIPLAYTTQTTFLVRFHEADEVTGCEALTLVTSDPAGELWFNETVEPDGLPFTTQVNVSASFQGGATPALSVTNDGTGTCNITIRLLSDPGTGRSMKFNTTDSAPWPSDVSKEVPLDPSSVTVCSGVGPSGTCDIWLWADFDDALGGQAVANVRVESV
ncbi:MAG: hypothetical protein ACE5KQ_00365 [Thermoplasmata archaeon]